MRPNGVAPASCKSYVLMTQADVPTPYVEPTPDPAVAAAFWSFGLTTVVSLYLVSKYTGEIVGFVKSALR